MRGIHGTCILSTKAISSSVPRGTSASQLIEDRTVRITPSPQFNTSTLDSSEGPEWRTKEGGSEWEPIKILLKNSAYEPKIHSNTSVFFSCQIHVAIGVLLDLGAIQPTETQKHAAENNLK
jgi:hypothetical protein